MIESTAMQIRAQEEPTPTTSHTGSRCSVSSHHTGSVHRSSEASSFASSADAKVYLGGDDRHGPWARNSAGVWQRIDSRGQTEPNMIRLSDYRNMPKRSDGESTSFGSIGHLVHDERCKVCVFTWPGRVCQFGRLCRPGRILHLHSVGQVRTVHYIRLKRLYSPC